MRWIESIKSIFQNQLPGAGSDYWYDDPINYQSSKINVDRALQIATVYTCVNILASSIASLPLITYRRLPGGGKEEATDHPLYNLLKYTPNDWQTKFTFCQQMVAHAALRGNFYSAIQYNQRGEVVGLEPLIPQRMQVEKLPNGQLRFTYTDDDGRQVRYLQGELLRFHTLTDNGYTGLSVIGQARRTMSLASNTEEYGDAYFSNGARPGGILTSDGPMDTETRNANKESWERAHRGAKNAHKVAVLSSMKFQPITITNEDSQFLETRRFTKEEICGLFGIPPHLAADLSRATFSNIEHQDIGFYKHTIRHWVTNIEQSIKRDLIIEDDIFAEFKVDALLRGDSESRANYYSAALGSGGSPAWMTPNEIRALENLNPINGGDALPVATNIPDMQQTTENQ